MALVSPGGVIPPNAPRFRFYPAARSIGRGFAATVRLLAGAPFHSLLAAPYDWPEAIERARRDLGTVDAMVVLLSRLDPWVRTSLPPGLHVLDAIDSLRRSMEERSRQAPALMRWLWSAEAKRVGRAEADAVRFYDRVVVVSDEDCAELDAVAISNGVEIAPPGNAPRSYDFAFWGRLAYFANADAATWLIREIWPLIREQKPDATLLIGGADAPAAIRAAHGRNGIIVQSPVDDVPALTRNVKVALFPVRFGTGQSNKVLEAAEGGCAIVATKHAMRGLEALTPYASIADDASALARAAVAAVPNDALRTAVETHYSRSATLERLRKVVQR
ncbi:MAG TPA: glycosyltransferase [Casimicrobiaceae bacterium]|nr:glycosyltransferase [Casimicrobiaceae bacterium]